MLSGIVAATSILYPPVILALCVVAGIATVLMLPSKFEPSIRKIGGAIMLAVVLIFAGLLLTYVSRQTDAGVTPYFWIFSAVALFGAFRVITHTRPVYSALYFVLTVLASAGLFILMWAEFMAVALILIYAGAILVTYVFVIMLAAEAAPVDQPATIASETDRISREPIPAAAIGFTLMGLLLFLIFDRADEIARKPETLEVASNPEAFSGSTQQLGLYLFNNHFVNLELAGLLLTVSMVGAIIIARKRVVTEAPATGEVVVGPATPIDDNPHSIPVYGTDNPRQKAYPET